MLITDREAAENVVERHIAVQPTLMIAGHNLGSVQGTLTLAQRNHPREMARCSMVAQSH
jgi:hypothetical protein